MFFSIYLGKKNSEATALVGILKKNTFPRIKTFIFLFSHDFMTDNLGYYPQMLVF